MTLKLIVLLWSYLGCVAFLAAQPKHNYIWMLGGQATDTVFKLGGCRLDFNQQPVRITQIKINGESSASYQTMSDEQGRLLYYTNGCHIYNTDYEIMEGGDTLNAGYPYNWYCGKGVGYAGHGLSLPYPGKSGVYTYLHTKVQDSGYYHDLNQTVIDMNVNGGKGRVISKNVLVLSDSLCPIPAAVRHANGRDWWIVMVRYAPATNGFHLLLLTPEGIQYMGKQRPYNAITTLEGHFSPDGTKFCYGAYPPGVGVLDFDRGTGILSNPRLWNPPFDSVSTTSRAVATSPNSKYLYVTTGARLYQHDLTAPDIEKSGEIIYELHKSGEPMRHNMMFMQLAPDGRIFVMPFAQTLKMHVIHEPDKKGKACRFEPNGITLPVRNWIYLPLFPNYRLGALSGSPYDTLYKAPEKGIRVSPNPADQRVQVEIASLEGDPYFELFDALGRLVYSENLLQRYTWLPIDYLPSAIYFYRVRRKTHQENVGGKLVIRH